MSIKEQKSIRDWERYAWRTSDCQELPSADMLNHGPSRSGKVWLLSPSVIPSLHSTSCSDLSLCSQNTSVTYPFPSLSLRFHVFVLAISFCSSLFMSHFIVGGPTISQHIPHAVLKHRVPDVLAVSQFLCPFLILAFPVPSTPCSVHFLSFSFNILPSSFSIIFFYLVSISCPVHVPFFCLIPVLSSP